MTAVEHDWRRTHAVLVAVERYNGSDGLNLDGPVHDALAMREWLTGQGVPAENIQLLASPLEHNRAALEAAHPGYRPAERADVRQVFQDELRSIDADWLWVYWAGHGVQTQRGRWSLLYPETRDTDLQGADADGLIHLMHTEHLPWDGVDRVTVIIDACRQALDPGVHELADEPDDLAQTPQVDVERPIYWMRACQAGAVAKQQQGTGRFTAALLRQLHAAVADGADLDLDRVWQGVVEEFERAGDAGRQRPTVYVSGWRENVRVVRLGPPGPPPGPPLDPLLSRFRETLVLEASGLLGADPAGSAARVAARLRMEFTDAPPATGALLAQELVDWALAHEHGLATLFHALAEQAPDQRIGAEAREACRRLQKQWLTCAEYTELVALLGRLDEPGRADVVAAAHQQFGPARLPAHDPVALADALEELVPRPHQLPQLLSTVEHFAAYSDGAVAAELRVWAGACAVRLGMKDVLLDHRARATAEAERARTAGPAERRRIQIRLHPPHGPGQRRAYEVWARRGDEVDALAKVDTPASPEEMQRGIDALLAAHARATETVVEFFVPSTDLELDVHRWPLDAGKPQERSLGTDFPVVLRCAELRQPERRHLWERRWSRVAGATPGDLHWLPGHTHSFAQVRAAMERQETAPGAMTASPAWTRSKIFTACLFDGVPVLVWDTGTKPALTEQQLRTLLGTGPLEHLPQRLRKLRLESDADESHPGRQLALLWDDPHRPLPDRLDLSAP
ncbi:VMAP-C domain-containing protein [Streptomyces sp. S465]|uniref:VMAP-C domain-containing protein n=1 Tax=Streptomyces sp. S465 TaxID=2979468 RepID=UPI0022A81EFE|nr:caspase family protein [Streptomyces sp. S465]WAP55904.1 caspase family protein [Streptomyces sp. S465]